MNSSWSPGAPIRLADGVLHPLGVIPESGEYVLRAVVTTVDASEWVPRRRFRRQRARPPRRTRFDDLLVVDNEGVVYAHERTRLLGMVRHGRGPGRVERLDLDVYLDSPPSPSTEWIELRGSSGAATRLFRGVAARADVAGIQRLDVAGKEWQIEALGRQLVGMRLAGLRAGERFYGDRCQAALARMDEMEEGAVAIPTAARLGVTALCRYLMEGGDVDSVPPPWRTILDQADKCGGTRRNADLGVDLPPIDGVILTLGTIAFEDDSWCLYAHATPSWWPSNAGETWTGALGRIEASDDLGGIYVAIHDGGRLRSEGGEVVRQRFRPRLDPSAKLLRFIVRGISEELSVDVSLPPSG